MGSTRLPLQLGANSLWHGFRASVTVIPGLVFILGALLAKWGGEDWLFFLGTGALLFGYGLYQLTYAWLTRACDVLLDTSGIRLDGGPHHGTHLTWSEIDLDQSSCKEVIGGTLRLLVGRHDGDPLLLASAEHPVEKDSLRSLFSTLQARLSPPKEAPPRNPQLWSCVGCKAALVPIDAVAVHCSYCGTANDAPLKLRDKIRKQAQDADNRKDIASMVEELMNQPGARHASIVLSVYSLLSVLPWVASLGTLIYLGFENSGGFEIGLAFVSGILGSLMLFVFARSALVKRGALQLLTTAFSALKIGEQTVCRRCQAPLPAQAGQLLCSCAYCNTENIMGVDVSRRHQESKGQRLTLKELIKKRRKERGRWNLLAFGSLGLGALAGLIAAVSIFVSAEFAATMTKCEGGDAEACLEISTDFYLGVSVSKNEEKGLDYAYKACEMGLAEGCFELSDYYDMGLGGLEADEAEAMRLRAMACEMGHQPACAKPE